MTANEFEASGGARLRYRVGGPPDGPVCVLGHSLGTTLELWDPQAQELARDWRVVRYDLRGHGGSSASPGPYTVAELAIDVLDLADELGVDTFAYCGLSLGGAVGSWLAVHYPDRVSALVLCCTAGKLGQTGDWLERASRVRAEGMEWLAATAADRWFTAEFPTEAPAEVERVLGMLRGTDPEGYASCCEALADFDLRESLGHIRAATRVIAGDRDPVTPESAARELADAISGAELLVVPHASHLANVERPATVTAAIDEHLRRSLPHERVG